MASRFGNRLAIQGQHSPYLSSQFGCSQLDKGVVVGWLTCNQAAGFNVVTVPTSTPYNLPSNLNDQSSSTFLTERSAT